MNSLICSNAVECIKMFSIKESYKVHKKKKLIFNDIWTYGQSKPTSFWYGHH